MKYILHILQYTDLHTNSYSDRVTNEHLKRTLKHLFCIHTLNLLCNVLGSPSFCGGMHWYAVLAHFLQKIRNDPQNMITLLDIPSKYCHFFFFTKRSTSFK